MSSRRNGEFIHTAKPEVTPAPREGQVISFRNPEKPEVILDGTARWDHQHGTYRLWVEAQPGKLTPSQLGNARNNKTLEVPFAIPDANFGF